MILKLFQAQFASDSNYNRDIAIFWHLLNFELSKILELIVTEFIFCDKISTLMMILNEWTIIYMMYSHIFTAIMTTMTIKITRAIWNNYFPLSLEQKYHYVQLKLTEEVFKWYLNNFLRLV